jgi:NAD(P)-dependent dehydrogenase (short-subunit alcohol dehydrogenase family)
MKNAHLGTLQVSRIGLGAMTMAGTYTSEGGLDNAESIRTMLVEPGYFRTELLTPESTTYSEHSIDDYAERTAQIIAGQRGMNGQQPGDPAKLAAALLIVAQEKNPPRRWIAGADAVAAVEQKARDLLAQADAYRELSSNLAYDDA